MRALHVDAMAWLRPKLGQLTTDQRKAAHVSKTHLSSTFTAHVEALTDKLGPKIEPAFMALAAETAKANAKALAGLGLDVRGQLGPQIEAFREWNLSLIKNAGREYIGQIAGVLDNPQNWGLRVEELTKLLVERGDVAESHAALIARDQTSKLNAAINQHRQQSAGVTSYVWSTSLDERVRETHVANEGQTFEWASPPEETGHPGDDIQCRCIAIPEIPELGDEEGAPPPEEGSGEAAPGEPAATPEAAAETPPEPTEAPEPTKDPERAEAGRKGARRRAERNTEINSFVKDNLPPELHPIWERDGRAFMQNMGAHAGLDPADVKELKAKGDTRYRQAIAERVSSSFLEQAQLEGAAGGGDFQGEVFGLSESKGEEAIARHERDLAEKYEAEARARGDVDAHGELTAQGREAEAARERAEREALNERVAPAEASHESGGFFDDLLGGPVDDVPF